MHNGDGPVFHSSGQNGDRPRGAGRPNTALGARGLSPTCPKLWKTGPSPPIARLDGAVGWMSGSMSRACSRRGRRRSGPARAARSTSTVRPPSRIARSSPAMSIEITRADGPAAARARSSGHCRPARAQGRGPLALRGHDPAPLPRGTGDARPHPAGGPQAPCRRRRHCRTVASAGACGARRRATTS